MKNKSIIKKITNVVIYVITGIIAICSAVIIYSNIKGSIGFIGNYTFMWVKTESMEPSIPRRSYILVKKADKRAIEKIKVDDIIVFRSDDPTLGGALNTHRVASIIGKNEEFVTRGDNNMRVDEVTAKAGNVVGIYKRNLTLLTVFGRVLSTSVGKMIAVTMILVLMMAIYLPDLKAAKAAIDDEIKKKKQEQIDALVKEEIKRLQAENKNTEKTSDKENNHVQENET